MYLWWTQALHWVCRVAAHNTGTSVLITVLFWSQHAWQAVPVDSGYQENIWTCPTYVAAWLFMASNGKVAVSCRQAYLRPGKLDGKPLGHWKVTCCLSVLLSTASQFCLFIVISVTMQYWCTWMQLCEKCAACMHSPWCFFAQLAFSAWRPLFLQHHCQDMRVGPAWLLGRQLHSAWTPWLYLQVSRHTGYD